MTVPILFLHGWAMDGAMFKDVANRLGADYDCHAPDLPGHGQNLTVSPSLNSCVDFARRAIEDLDQPILVGWSMGAAVAWRYIAQYGTAGIRGLVTIDMSPRLLPGADWSLGLLHQTEADIRATSAKIEPHWHRMVQSIIRNMYAAGRAEEQDSSAMQEFLKKQSPARLRPLWDDLVALDERHTIARIDIPYLVCTGAQSRLYSSDVGGWIARTAPQARVETFENSGHSPHLEEPDAFCAALSRFATLDCAPR